MSVKGLFFSDFRNKATALVIAAGVWFYAYATTQSHKDGVAVPVHVHTDPGWVITNVRGPGNLEIPIQKSPGLVTVMAEVSLRYPRRSEHLVQDAIRTGAIHGQIQVRSPDAVEKEMALLTDNFRVPPGLGVRIAEVQPPFLRLTLTHERTRPDVPVEPRVSAPPPGSRIEMVWPNPRRVAVTGPESLLDRLERVYTREINIRDLPPQFGIPIDVAARIEETVELDGQTYRIQADERINCRIYLAPEMVTRTFEDVPIFLLAPTDFLPGIKLELSKPAIPVEVEGVPDAVNNLRKEDILLFIDARNIDPAPGRRQYHAVEWRLLGVSPGEAIRIREPEQISTVVVERGAEQ